MLRECPSLSRSNPSTSTEAAVPYAAPTQSESNQVVAPAGQAGALRGTVGSAEVLHCIPGEQLLAADAAWVPELADTRRVWLLELLLNSWPLARD
jgi:hypothetical protein